MKNLTDIIKISCAIFLACLLYSCGTHGSIKSYLYSINKNTLQQAVMAVIKDNSTIYRDTSLDHLGSSPSLDHSNSDSDYIAGTNYYNDIKHYVTITITSGKTVNTYTFRYYGADEEWNSSTFSEIFICYAHDKNGNGGSQGDMNKEMAKKFTDVFETEFVAKLDNKLNLTHL